MLTPAIGVIGDRWLSSLPQDFGAAAVIGGGSAIVPRGFCYGDIPLRIVFLFFAGLLSFGVMAAPGDVATLIKAAWDAMLKEATK